MDAYTEHDVQLSSDGQASQVWKQSRHVLGMGLLRAQFLIISIQVVAALDLSTSSAVELSYSSLIIKTKSNSICFHSDKDSSEVALLSTCDSAALPCSAALPHQEQGGERCQDQCLDLLRVYSELGARQYLCAI